LPLTENPSAAGSLGGAMSRCQLGIRRRRSSCYRWQLRGVRSPRVGREEPSGRSPSTEANEGATEDGMARRSPTWST
jgi:hypothetical protein